MIIDFMELGKYDFSLHDINLLYRKPNYNNITINPRAHNAFWLIKTGSGLCKTEKTTAALSPGTMIYLPMGTSYDISLQSKVFEFYRIDFILRVGDEIALFSDEPLIITNSVNAKCLEAVKALQNECNYSGNNITRLEKLCAILASAIPTTTSSLHSKISHAVKYIDAHFTEAIDCKKLAELCFLSVAQFYNLFKKNIGTTPLEYKNALILSRAKALLSEPEITVTEVSEILGFESVAYFSRFFKKRTNTSPSVYIKQSKTV